MFTRHKYKDASQIDWTKVPNPAATIKRDGSHFFLSFDSKGTPSYISRRRGVNGEFPDKTNRVPHLADVKLPQYAGHTYSVELVHTGKKKTEDDNHARLSGILNSLPARALATQNELGPVRAVLLDSINPPLPTYGDKIAHLQEVEKAFNKPELVFNPEVHVGIPKIVKLIAHTKVTGKEGVIITSLTKPEDDNLRIKVKHRDTYNLRVVGMEEAHDIYGNLKGVMGSLLLVDSTNKPVGKSGTGFSADDRADAWNNKRNWIDSLRQFKTFGQGGVNKSGKLKVMVYNGEAENCDKISP